MHAIDRFDMTNGNWYRDHYTAIVRKFKQHDVRVVVGSPGLLGQDCCVGER